MKRNNEVEESKLNSQLEKYETQVTQENIENAEKKASKFKDDPRISALWNKIQMMFEIAKHPKIWGSQVALWVGAALIYLVSPLDLLPDILPVVGLTDDIAAILLVLNRVSSAVSRLFQNNPSKYLQLFPEKLRPTVIKCFNLPVPGRDQVYETPVEKPKVKNLLLYFDAFFVTSSIIKRLGEMKDSEAAKGKTKSLKYRFADFILRTSENTANWTVDIAFNDQLQTSLDLHAERRFTRALISFLFFMLALGSYTLIPYGEAWMYISAFLFICSYSFVAVETVRSLIKAFKFVKSGFAIRKQYPFLSFTDCAVSSLACETLDIDPVTVSNAAREIKTNTYLRNMILRISYRLFNNSVLRVIIRLLLLSIVFYIMRNIAASMNYGMTPSEVVLGPIMMIIKKFA